MFAVVVVAIGRLAVLMLERAPKDLMGGNSRFTAGDGWHPDVSCDPSPIAVSLLRVTKTPPIGGDTQFVNMYAAYEALSPEVKMRIDGLKVIHKYQSSRQTNRVSKRPEGEMKAMPEATHPLVRTHPETGRKALYTSVAHTAHIKGWTEKESLPLLEFLWAHQVQPEFTCRFRWEKGSIASSR